MCFAAVWGASILGRDDKHRTALLCSGECSDWCVKETAYMTSGNYTVARLGCVEKGTHYVLDSSGCVVFLYPTTRCVHAIRASLEVNEIGAQATCSRRDAQIQIASNNTDESLLTWDGIMNDKRTSMPHSTPWWHPASKQPSQVFTTHSLPIRTRMPTSYTLVQTYDARARRHRYKRLHFKSHTPTKDEKERKKRKKN